jgi:hypothetical protein
MTVSHFTEEEFAKISALYRYYAPTEITKPKHDEITRVWNTAVALLKSLEDMLWYGKKFEGKLVDWQRNRYEDVHMMAVGFHCAIVKNSPKSADQSAALRCAALARNAMNDIIVHTKIENYGTPTLHIEPEHTNRFEIAEAELLKARYQANSAIALEGRV